MSVLTALMVAPGWAIAAIRRDRICHSNASWRNLFATSGDDSLEPQVSSVFPGIKSAERFERLLSESMHNGTARLEHLLTRSDGRTFMAQIVVHLIEPENDLGANAVWHVRDITAERDLRRELRELEDYYQALSSFQWDLTLVFDQHLTLSYVSPSVETVLGYLAPEILGRRVDSFLHPDEVEESRVRLERVVSGDNPLASESFQIRIRHADGEYRFFKCRQRNCLGIARIHGVVVNALDVTREVEERQAREHRSAYAARLNEALFRLATAKTPDGNGQVEIILSTAVETLRIQSASYWRFHQDGQRLTCEQSALSTLNGTVSDPTQAEVTAESCPLYVRELRTHRPIIVTDVRDHPAVSPDQALILVAANVGAMLDFPVVRSGQTLGVMSLESAGGPRIWESDEISFAAGLSLLVALALESAERSAAAARTEFLAMHDSLTGLANRNRAEGALRQAVEQAPDTDRTVTLLLIDLDEFKEINDTFGHGRGDILLSQVARLLVDCTAGRGLVARMGGDEFLVVLEQVGRAEVELLAQNIIDRLGAQTLLSGIDQHVGASIGIARYPTDGSDAETLLANADIAMYQAKAAGRNQYFVFSTQLAQRLKLQRDLDLEIRDALRDAQFSMFYQPQIDLDTGALVGLEALLRWEHPVRGLLLPSTFMAAAQHNGLIDTITKWAITEVCEQNISWQRAGLASVPISVNVTGRQFHDRHLPAMIASALMRTGLAAQDLILEVTEESLIESSQTTERVLRELRELGIRIAIDDFGVGYSSLSYLRRLVVSQIKLDRGFIEGLPHDEESSAIVSAVIAVARRLRYQVIAEGVETIEQVNYLRGAGCEAGQGFYFSAPLSALELTEFMTRRVTDARDEALASRLKPS